MGQENLILEKNAPDWERFYLFGHKVGQIEAEVRRLVVGRVLPGHAHAVGVVVHQRRHAVVCGDVGGEDVQRAAGAGIPEDELLAPVAEQVGL